MVIVTSAAIGGLIGFVGLIIFVIIIGSAAGANVEVPWLTIILYTLVGAALGAVVGVIIYFAN